MARQLRQQCLLVSMILCSYPGTIVAQPWSVATYPDKAGFQQRIDSALFHIAGRDFGKRSLAPSTCPDTGWPVKTWAVAGETIISPYTGRTYVQGPTGYFGPKAKNEQGQIISFGGDPLKYDLPPATAAMLLGLDTLRAKAFLAIPGNLGQHYHFAAKNWARFYPLLKDRMGPDWQAAFQKAADHYREEQRHESGPRGSDPLSMPHTLVGTPGSLLGGNSIDGGTENHKLMWRTSALTYAAHFPDSAHISRYPAAEAATLTKTMLRDYLKRLLYVGNGEYDSQVYYPHSIEGFLNLYDFSEDEETRLLAKFALDYYFATSGLKVVDGIIAGAQKRGYLPASAPGEMETMTWAFFNRTSRNMEGNSPGLHQATTRYRPNETIWKITNKQIPLPFEARISRPFYHMDRYNAFQESFYCTASFALGNVAMSIVDNPNQQLVWSLIAGGKDGPLGFTGGQPQRLTTSGHSAYTQTLQAKGTLLLLSAPTGQAPKDHPLTFTIAANRINPWHLPDTAQAADHERQNRLLYGAKPLQLVPMPDDTDSGELEKFWQAKEQMAASWLLIPKAVDSLWQRAGRVFIKANETLIVVQPTGKDFYLLRPAAGVVRQIADRNLKKLLTQYVLLVVPGQISGYALEAVDRAKYPSISDFERAVTDKTALALAYPNLRYQTLSGEQLQLEYQSLGLRAGGHISGKAIDYENWTGGAVYESPFISVKNGILKITDGKQGYQIDFRGELPVYSF